MPTCSSRLLSLLLFVSIALLSIPAQAGMEARWWPVGADMLDFAALDADNNPSRDAAYDLSALGIMSGSGATALADTGGNLILFGNQTRLFDRDSNLVVAMTAKTGNQTAALMPWPGEAGAYCQVYVKVPGSTIAYTKVRPYDAPSEVVAKDVAIPGTVAAVALTVCTTPDRSGYYVVTKTKEDAMAFQVLRLSAAGFAVLDVPVPAAQSGWAFGQYSNFKFSADGQQLAYGMKQASDSNGYVSLYAFDPQTGEITWDRNFQLTTTGVVSSVGGVEFSANGKYLYNGLKDGSTKVFQIDLQSGGVTEIASGATYAIAGFQLAPSGDIFACISNSGWLGRIRNPEAAHTGGVDGALYSTQNVLTNMARPGLPVFIASDLRRVPVEIATGADPGILSATLKAYTLPAGVSAAEFGVCWGTAANPAPAAFNTLHTAVGTRLAADMTTVLTPETRYYVRGYALGDDANTYYGDEIEMTLAGGSTTPSDPTTHAGGGGGGCFISTCW